MYGLRACYLRGLTNSMCNFKSSGKFGRSSQFVTYLNANFIHYPSFFFLLCPRGMSYFPDKLRSLPIPVKTLLELSPPLLSGDKERALNQAWLASRNK